MMAHMIANWGSLSGYTWQLSQQLVATIDASTGNTARTTYNYWNNQQATDYRNSMGADTYDYFFPPGTQYPTIKYIQMPKPTANSHCYGVPPNRVARWQGKVNQYVDAYGNWQTDPDGVSGAELIDADGGLSYCRKFYPITISTRNYQTETIYGWRNRGNVDGPFTLAVTTIECVMEGQRFTGSSGTIYAVINNMVRAIPDPTTYNNLFTSPWTYYTYPQYIVDSLPKGPQIWSGSYLQQNPNNGNVYMLDYIPAYGWAKKHVVNPTAMTSHGFNSGAVSQSVYVESTPSGSDITP